MIEDTRVISHYKNCQLKDRISVVLQFLFSLLNSFTMHRTRSGSTSNGANYASLIRLLGPNLFVIKEIASYFQRRKRKYNTHPCFTIVNE